MPQLETAALIKSDADEHNATVQLTDSISSDGRQYCLYATATFDAATTLAEQRHWAIESAPDAADWLLRPTIIVGLQQLTPTVTQCSLGDYEVVRNPSPADDEPVTTRYTLFGLPWVGTPLDTVTLNVGGLDVVIKRLEGSNHSAAEVENVPYRNRYSVYPILRELCWLFSLAVGNLVSIPEATVLRDQETIEAKRCWVQLQAHRNQGLISTEAVAIAEFVQHSYPRYQTHTGTYLLRNLIHVLNESKQALQIEMRVLLLANLLEIIRHNHAVNVAVPNGTFTADAANEHFYWPAATPGQRPRSASFRDILLDFCNTHRLTGWSDDFRDMRNEIIHTGQINGPIAETVDRYNRMHDFCARALLGVLEWDAVGGHYESPQSGNSVLFVR